MAADHYQVECPTCKSPPGRGCRTVNDTRRQPHSSRIVRAAYPQSSTGNQQEARLDADRLQRERYPFDPDDLRRGTYA